MNYWVVTVDNENGAADQTNIIIYKNGEPVKSGATTNKLSGLNDTDFFLGRSQWDDAAANASWEDFRIYDGAMDPLAVQLSNAQGPDIAPGQSPFEITNIEYNPNTQTASVTWKKDYAIWVSEVGQKFNTHHRENKRHSMKLILQVNIYLLGSVFQSKVR